ncbi:uncharacterized protein [Watersipora subatra]|uniref:uncharacterized protein n=1 Tax=Watersipora subatra TaxID=2589382 RepID=UPI00355B9506
MCVVEKHADVRLPSASSLQVGQPSASSNTEIETNSKPTLSSALPRQPAQQFNKMNLSDPMMTSIPDVSASSSSKAMSKGAISDHTDQDLLSSAAQAWAYLQSQTGATPTKCIESQMLDPPTVRICFSNFANDSQLAVADPRHRSLSLAGVKNPDTPLSKFINAPSNAGVLNASLNTLLGAPSLKLYFPIGVCPYDDGLVVCNSGDNTVLFIRHSSEGQVFNVLQLNVRILRVLGSLLLFHGLLMVTPNIIS